MFVSCSTISLLYGTIGVKLVDIREYYEDSAGQEKPGSKGIALRGTNQWVGLKEKMKDINEDVKNHTNSAYSIGDKRKVSASQYKGVMLIGIREYYQDNNTGEERPGAKGISLTLDQWNKLESFVSEIDDIINCLL